ncbi:MAG: hypothetical protein V1767_08595 [Chloroflexota bacterium]
MRVILKYCGSCNPEVDLAKIGRRFAELAREQGWELVPSDAEADVLVLLCGCPRTCANREEVVAKAKRVVLVAGRRLGWRAVAEEGLPLAIIEAISGRP